MLKSNNLNATTPSLNDITGVQSHLQQRKNVPMIAYNKEQFLERSRIIFFYSGLCTDIASMCALFLCKEHCKVNVGELLAASNIIFCSRNQMWISLSFFLGLK